MTIVGSVEEHEATGLVKEIYEEMKQVRGWDKVPVIWRVMALQPEYLKANWERYKAIMLNGSLDLLTKEMIALTVSMVNRCSYCIDSHSLAVKKLGLTQEQLVEMVSVIDFFAGTNVLSSGLKIEFEQPNQ
ncbi:carboxymuconolactone decarboxylase family protein [Alicyclobacillus mengziensis]|uniref:Carboxymuconolactone decarboxylase family protein n=1 Tax=Alicyclobacillus mengziensis TaxID=2931921 RepID=A0A9X7VXH6_9BACL|nr:carboxymuconolactone decarboxylase family protein [Alicyclobacillus mengziensis]QSO46886.1 carboxymuconolactone decarboxylase family protein [Alicyclobacillus mengziensis]